jgi:hypothetical protein
MLSLLEEVSRVKLGWIVLVSIEELTERLADGSRGESSWSWLKGFSFLRLFSMDMALIFCILL